MRRAAWSRARSRPARLADYVTENPAHAMAALSDLPSDPTSVQQALSGPDADKWREAMIAEVKSLQEHNTYSLVRAPPGVRLITAKWIFKTKRNDQGIIVKYKARLVARGFEQVEGIDFTEVFAPTSKHATMRAARPGS